MSFSERKDKGLIILTCNIINYACNQWLNYEARTRAQINVVKSKEY